MAPGSACSQNGSSTASFCGRRAHGRRDAVTDLGTAVAADRRRGLARAGAAVASGNRGLTLRPIESMMQEMRRERCESVRSLRHGRRSAALPDDVEALQKLVRSACNRSKSAPGETLSNPKTDVHSLKGRSPVTRRCAAFVARPKTLNSSSRRGREKTWRSVTHPSVPPSQKPLLAAGSVSRMGVVPGSAPSSANVEASSFRETPFRNRNGVAVDLPQRRGRHGWRRSPRRAG